MSYIKDVDLPRHAWDTPPFLLIVSPTLPVQSVDAYVRTYARSVTWQPNEKRLTIFHEYGTLSHARFARAGAPLSPVLASFCNSWRISRIRGSFDELGCLALNPKKIERFLRLLTWTLCRHFRTLWATEKAWARITAEFRMFVWWNDDSNE